MHALRRNGRQGRQLERFHLYPVRKSFVVGEDRMIADSDLYWYRARLSKAVDGDTVDFFVDLGFNFQTKMRFRVLGINAPELKGETLALAKEARAFLSSILGPASDAAKIRIKSHRDESDKYGRYLCEIYAPVGYNSAGDPKSAYFEVDPSAAWCSINDLMVRAGYAVEYMKE